MNRTLQILSFMVEVENKRSNFYKRPWVLSRGDVEFLLVENIIKRNEAMEWAETFLE